MSLLIPNTDVFAETEISLTSQIKTCWKTSHRSEGGKWKCGQGVTIFEKSFLPTKKEDDFAFEGIDERKHWQAFSLIEKERESIGGPLGLRKEGSHQRKSSGALSRGQFAQQKFCKFRKR